MVAKKTTKKKEKLVQVTGHRKRAVARATAKKGSGIIVINSKPMKSYPEIPQLMMMEPLMIAGDVANGVDINVNVNGGGVMGQADAVRQAIAKVLVKFSRGLKSKFLDYDRHLLVADSRRTEPHKPSRSSQGPRRHKQRSKR
jgi:small subunit ribosomal protein S9